MKLRQKKTHKKSLGRKLQKKKIAKKKSSKQKVSQSNQSKSNKMKPSHGSQVQKSFLNQNTLYIIATVFFILALLAFYFRRRIVKEFIETRNFVIQPVYAQVIPDAVKKKLII